MLEPYHIIGTNISHSGVEDCRIELINDEGYGEMVVGEEF